MSNFELARRALPVFVKALGRAAHVETVIEGKQAYTDGRRVVLPAVDPTDEDAVAMTYALARHEIAHLRYGDLETFEREMPNMSPLRRAITNIIRDIVDERALVTDYPGAKRDFLQGYRRLVVDGQVQPVVDGMKPAQVLTSYMHYRLRNDVLDQAPFADLAEGAERHARSMFSPGCMAKIGAALGRVVGISSSSDAIRIADDVVRILKEESEDPPPPRDAGENGQGENGTVSAGAQPGQGSGQDTGREMATEALHATDADLNGNDLGQVMGEALQKAASEAEANGVGGCHAGGIGFADEPGLAIEDPELLKSVRAASNALRFRLQSLVEASREEDDWLSPVGFDLDDFVVDRIPLGETSVFRQDIGVDAVNTAVMILFDRSGSMSGEAITIAKQASLAVAHALERIPDVAVAVAAFPGHRNDVLPVVRFGEVTTRTTGRFASLNASGGTPMTEGIWYGLDELLARPEPRKLLMVVTDGQPNNQRTTVQALAIARTAGVETYGIGIGSTPVRELFPTACEIDTVKDLAPRMFGMLETALISRAA